MPLVNFGSVASGFSKDDLANQLRDLLQDTVQFRFLAHGAHWNVTGVNFQQFHQLFESIYSDADEAIDPLAENIRKLNILAPIQLSDYMESKEEPGEIAPTLSTDPVELAKVVYAANEDCLECVIKGIAIANALNEQGILNFLAERQDMHAKWQWQLRTIVGDAFADQNEVDVSTVTPGEENEA